MSEVLKNLFQKAEIEVNNHQLAKFKELLIIFQEWNQKLNLTAIKLPDEIIIKHFIY